MTTQRPKIRINKTQWEILNSMKSQGDTFEDALEKLIKQNTRNRNETKN